MTGARTGSGSGSGVGRSRFGRLFALSLLAVCVCGSERSEVDPEPIRIPLVPTREDPASDAWVDALSVWLEVAPVQPAAPHGLRFALGIDNAGAELRVHNPLGALTLEILDEQGYPIGLRPAPPPQLINDRSDQIALRTFRLDDDATEELRAPVVRIPASGRFVAPLRVAEVAPAGGDGSATAIPPGRYRIRASLALTLAGETKGGRVFRSERVEVRLTGP